MDRYLRVNLLGPSPRLMKKEFTGRGLTKVEKHWCRSLLYLLSGFTAVVSSVNCRSAFDAP